MKFEPPAAPMFDAFGDILRMIYTHGVAGFEPVASLDDLAYYARQRMEFLKRSTPLEPA